MTKLGLIAGAGALPVSLARHCQAVGRPLFVVRLEGAADLALEAFEGCGVGLASLGRTIAKLKGAGCQAVCLAGRVARPDMGSLKPDMRGLAALPGALAAARRGDDALLSFLVREFEREGFAVEGAQDVMPDLILNEGPVGRRRPRRNDLLDVRRAFTAAKAIGAIDAGQAAVSCDGLILALEAQEGTDAMLGRVAGLPFAVRGDARRRKGVLAKVCKPGQERRIDLPTIGPATIRRAAEAGLAGVAGEAGFTLLLDRERVAALADDLGIFVIGAPACA